MKKILKFILLTFASLMFVLHFNNLARASTSDEVHLTMGFSNLDSTSQLADQKLTLPRYQIYGLNQASLKRFDQADSDEKLCQTAFKAIKEDKITVLASLKPQSLSETMDLIVPKYAGYLVIAADNDGNPTTSTDANTTSVPSVISTDDSSETDSSGLTHYQVYAKYSVTTRKPYFFKYGKNAAGTLPLEGAKFVIYRLNNAGEELYLNKEGEFVKSISALENSDIVKFTSNSAGLVLYDGATLANGTYYFKEVQAPSGYTISKAAQKIKIEITDSQIKVNDTVLDQLYDGSLTDATVKKALPRVYNEKKPTTPKTPSKVIRTILGMLPHTGSSVEKKIADASPDEDIGNLWGMLPQTGEAKSFAFWLGLGIVIICLIRLFIIFKKKRKHEER